MSIHSTIKSTPINTHSIEQLEKRIDKNSHDLIAIFKSGYLRAPEYFQPYAKKIENIKQKCSKEQEFTPKDLRFLTSEKSCQYLLTVPDRIVNKHKKEGPVDIYGKPSVKYFTILNNDKAWILHNLRRDRVTLNRLLIEVITQPFKNITNTPPNTPQCTPPTTPSVKSPFSSPIKLSSALRCNKLAQKLPLPTFSRNLFAC